MAKTFHTVYKLKLQIIIQYTNHRKNINDKDSPKKPQKWLISIGVLKNLKHIIENNINDDKKKKKLYTISVGGKVLPARFCRF